MAYNQRTGQGSNYVLRTGLSSFNDLDATDITSGTFDAARLPSITKSKVSNTGTWESSEIPNLSATKITSDELDADRIPDLSASKITSGTLAATHIPDLSATKITSDELDADRIPNLSATKITSGTLATTHIPDLSANKITTDALHVDRIPNLDADWNQLLWWCWYEKWTTCYITLQEKRQQKSCCLTSKYYRYSISTCS